MKRTALTGRPALLWALLALGGLAAGGLLLNIDAQKPLGGGLRAVAALVFVLGVLFVGSTLVKKFSSRLGRVVPRSTVDIEVKGTRGIGSGRWLLVVQVAGESFLISSGRDGVELLAKLEPRQGDGDEPPGERGAP